VVFDNVSEQSGSFATRRPVLAMVLFLNVFMGSGLLLAAPGDGAADAVAHETRRDEYRLLPETRLYPLYLADPYRSVFALQRVTALDSEIPQAGDRRWGLKLGGVFGLVRLYPAGDPERGWQLDFEGGVRGLFDVDNSTDNIGWDGVYSLQLAWKPNASVAWRIALHHNSAHIGDEYAERTGAERLDYTREELRVGVAAGQDTRWTVYADIGRAYTLRNGELQKPWRVQSGLQYTHPTELFGGALGAYGAVDVNAFEENDWDAALSLQAGIYIPAPHRVWRAGLELYDGRSTQGEFFFREERYVLLGLWLDL
jgi:hypothetical protein